MLADVRFPMSIPIKKNLCTPAITQFIFDRFFNGVYSYMSVPVRFTCTILHDSHLKGFFHLYFICGITLIISLLG